VSDYIQINSQFNTPASITLSAWVKINDWSSSGCDEMISLEDRLAVRLRTDQVMGFFHDGTTWRNTAYSSINYKGTGWHYFTYTFQSDVQTVYVDGQNVAATSYSGSISYSGSTTMLGQHGGGGLHFLNGLMDDVRIYNRALSADEIKRLYKIGGTAKINTSISGPTNGLVGWWTFDGKYMSNSRAFDASGQGNYGTLTGANGLPTRAIGKLGQAMQFDGSDDYVDLASTDGFSTGSGATWTLAAWAKTDVLNSNYHFIVGYGDGTNGTSPHIQLDNLNHWQTSTYANDLSGPPAVKGQWTHVVGVGSGTTLRLYIDGQQYASTVVTNAPVTTRARIGTDMGASPALNFDGLLDDVRIYNRALSADETKWLYKIGGTFKVNTSINNNRDSLEKGLVGWWTFDGKDMAGNYAFDKSGSGNRGTLTGGPVRGIGKIGQGLSFDGVDDYVDIGTAPNLANKSFTISAWAKRKVISSEIAIFAQGTASQNNALIFEFRDTNVFTCSFWSNDLNTPTAYTDRDWHLWMCTYDANTNQRRIYRDGVQVASDTSGGDYAGSGNTSIGYRLPAIGAGQAFNGLIDDVRIYTRVLSADEIKRLYNMGR
jgi:hypothetical protein